MERSRTLFVGLGLGMVALIVTATVLNAGPSSVPVLLGFAVTSAVFLLWRAAPNVVAVILFAAMATLVVVFHGFVSTTPLALFLLAALATWREPRRWTALVLVAATLAHIAVQLALGQDTVLTGVATLAGVVFLYSIGRLLVSERQQREKVAELLEEVEQRRSAERMSFLVAERGRMARELHDVLAHTLSGLAIQLESARILTTKGATPPALQEAVERAQQLSKTGLQEARRAVATLRGDELPGPDQLPALVDEHRLSASGPVRLTVRGHPRRLDAEASLAIYRTAQEALSNVRKHAQGAAVDVTLDWSDAEVVLTVQDDGGAESAVGAPATLVADEGVAAAPGFGLTGMSERASLLGATLATGPSDAGYRVRLSVPLDAADPPGAANGLE